MFKKFLNVSFLFIFLTISSLCVNAQIGNCSNIGENSRDPYPEQIREKLTELCIKKAKEDFQELLDRGEEIAKLTEELEISYLENNNFSSEDKDKLDRVEKLLDKIRDDLKADSDDEEDKTEKPKTISETLKILKEKTSNLFDELKKTSRYSVSAVAIQSSNAILRLVKLLKN